MEADALCAMFEHIESLGILPVFFPNTGIDTDENKEPTVSHIRVYALPVDPTDNITTCGVQARYRWLLQASVYIREGEGQVKAARYVDELRSATTPNKKIVYNTRVFKVKGNGRLSPAIVADGWFNYPLTFTIEIIE